jgi:hypothetical protein
MGSTFRNGTRALDELLSVSITHRFDLMHESLFEGIVALCYGSLNLC